MPDLSAKDEKALRREYDRLSDEIDELHCTKGPDVVGTRAYQAKADRLTELEKILGIENDPGE